jgi:hypothetical protein
MNMQACLEWWSWIIVRIHLDVTTNVFHFALFPCKHKIRGRAWKHRGSWYALRVSDENKMLLQIDKKILGY